jgi:murein DD-endopeptidase MepM/ murein hydrolase activator NlpD
LLRHAYSLICVALISSLWLSGASAQEAPVVSRSLKRVPVGGETLAPAPEGPQVAPKAKKEQPKAKKAAKPSTDKPAATTEKPAVTTDKPAATKDKPPATTDKPGVAAQESAQPVVRRVLRRQASPEAGQGTQAAEQGRKITRERVAPEGEFVPVEVERKVVVKPKPEKEEVDLSASFVFAYPVKKARVTSHFGMRRHPKLRRRKMHKGTDFGGGRGTPVLATGPAKVVRAGRCGGGAGNCVVLEHADGWVSRYFHLSKVEAKVGQVVGKGDQIGRIGSTGRSTGPHLHFQIERHGHPVNPMKAMGKRSDRVRR